MTIRSLTDRSLSAVRWNYLGNATRALLQLAISIILARLIGPEAFGVVAIAWLMIGIGGLFTDLGFSAALVQRQHLDNKDVAFVFTVQLGVGAALTLASVLCAGQLALFFRHPDVANVVRAMSLVFVIRAAGQTSAALLSRALRFDISQVIAIGSYFVGYALVGIPLAFYGFGAWSLVAAQVVQTVTSTTGLLAMSGWSVRLAFRPATRGLFSFGGQVVGANVMSWTIRNLDSVLVGRNFNLTSLGLYNRATTLVATPLGLATTSLQGLLFSACSRANGELARVKRAYLAATGVLSYACLPIFLTIASIPETVISGAYGGQWEAASSLVVPLALSMIANALLSLIGPVLTALGSPSRELRAQFVTLLVALPTLYFLAQESVEAVAWGVLLIAIVRLALLVFQIVSLIGLRIQELLRVLALPIVCAVATAIPVWAADQLLAGVSPQLRLLVAAAVAGIVLLVMMRILGPRLMSGPVGELLLPGGRLPGPLRRWIRVYELQQTET